MALYQRRDSVGRTRFLLALTLSTVTAVGVAAPLAIQALRSDEDTFAAINPDDGGATTVEEASGPIDAEGRSLESEIAGIGGISAEPGSTDPGASDDGQPGEQPGGNDGNNSTDDGSTVEETPSTARLDAPATSITTAAGSSSPHPERPTTTVPRETTTTTKPSSSTTEDPENSTSTTESPPITNGETSSTTSSSTTTTAP